MATTTTTKATRSCFCGCGGQTQRAFVPGHDARFHGLVKKTLRGELDTDTVLAGLPHEEAVEAFHDYAEKIAPAELARAEAKAAEKAAKDEAKAVKLAAKASPATTPAVAAPTDAPVVAA